MGRFLFPLRKGVTYYCCGVAEYRVSDLSAARRVFQDEFALSWLAQGPPHPFSSVLPTPTAGCVFRREYVTVHLAPPPPPPSDRHPNNALSLPETLCQWSKG